MSAPMHPELLLPAEESLGQSNNLFRRNLPSWQVGSIGHEATTGKEATVDEFVSLFEERLRLFERGLKTGKVIRFHSTDKSPRIGELSTDLPLALGLIEGLQRGEHAQKIIDLALCVCGVKRHESKWSNEIAFESSDHVCHVTRPLPPRLFGKCSPAAPLLRATRQPGSFLLICLD